MTDFGPVSGAFEVIGGAVSSGADTSIDLVQRALDALGLETGAIDQFQLDAAHFAGLVSAWATGERIPAVSELLASGALVLGSGGVAFYEAATGQDTALLDDRPGGIVHDVRSTTGPAGSPQSLQDLVLDNRAPRMDNPTGAALETGQIGIQQVQGSHGGDPVYIVQVPSSEAGSAVSTGTWAGRVIPGTGPPTYG